MREVAPGDLIFSYADGVIRGFGIATTHCYTSPRPDEFGHIGEVWDAIGWRVDVPFVPIQPALRPSGHMRALAPLLPGRYSPIRPNGHGNQGVYLAEIPQKMALMLGQLISPELLRIVQGTRMEEAADAADTELRGISEWEELEAKRISEDRKLRETTRMALI